MRIGAERVAQAVGTQNIAAFGLKYTLSSAPNILRDIDILLNGGAVIEVGGGPTEGLNLFKFDSKSVALTEYARNEQVQAYFYYAPGTRHSVIDAALQYLPVANVRPIP